ncbi:hypothetical protein Pla163_21340 [Planctomycetes bacterium Pla163]|uniref:(Na+)-NQR maturation NqrM n=1 Tax=Rohdeia mirabilis TaxID=2528008 RepID=A0A518D0L2_9BACT|nr:hypothetical protein Pla163_21340 [Planctomycetes bacterium Pla163]
MATFLVTLAFFLIAVGAMSVGLLRGRRLSGSCGGLDKLGQPIGECVCGKPMNEGCSVDPEQLDALLAERAREGASS